MDKGIYDKELFDSFIRYLPLSARKPEATTLSEVTTSNKSEIDVFSTQLFPFQKYFKIWMD